MINEDKVNAELHKGDGLPADLFDNRPKVKQASPKRRLNILPANPEETPSHRAVGLGRFPSWLHRPLPQGNELWATNRIMRENRLHTVCEEARCPNLLECWSKKTATFLVMGKECSRSCGFCSIDFNKAPQPLDPLEPQRVAESVADLGLKHVVITMVARDDLPDGGGAHLAEVVRAIRRQVPDTTIEVLTSDFAGNWDAVDAVLAACPEIYNYNIETVRQLTPQVRHKATYERTLALLSHVKAHAKKQAQLHSENSGGAFFVKSGMMVGLGESEEQVYETIRDLGQVGCDIITIGQYLQPARNKLLVKAFVTPEQFVKYADYGYSVGIKNMYCGPFVRSSYNANLVMQQASGQLKTINSQ